MLVHGLTDHRDGFVLPQLAAALAGAGVSSLRLDMRGNGESEGEFEFANMRDEARPCGTAPTCPANQADFLMHGCAPARPHGWCAPASASMCSPAAGHADAAQVC